MCYGGLSFLLDALLLGAFLGASFVALRTEDFGILGWARSGDCVRHSGVCMHLQRAFRPRGAGG